MDSIINQLKIKLQPDPNIKDDKKDKKQNEEVELRSKKNLFDAMIKKYQNTIQRFQDEESGIIKVKETKLIRGAEIILGQDLDEKEKKEIIHNPQMAQQIMVNKLTVVPDITLVNAVRDLEERHKEIKNLEKSIIELHKMIIQLNIIVQYQGEMIDNIVENISKAKDYLLDAEEKIGEGENNLKSSQKKKIIIMIVVIAILLVIFIPIIIKFI